jgi:gas vesicle protein
MVMKAIKGAVDFAAGVAIGAIAGAGVAYLTAPKSGRALKADGQELIDSAKHAGERARIDRETELRDKFRKQVNSQDALSALVDEAAIATDPPATSIPFPS